MPAATCTTASTRTARRTGEECTSMPAATCTMASTRTATCTGEGFISGPPASGRTTCTKDSTRTTKKNGRGVYRFANGNVYDGEWRDDKMHGRASCAGDGGSTRRAFAFRVGWGRGARMLCG
mmetsp:Transcript_20605/g.43262  ORF Transcript_20605/g.43262 Transcript_20605/m.43262 type:complete len:122 (+) Transcript_20605:2-367(+)